MKDTVRSGPTGDRTRPSCAECVAGVLVGTLPQAGSISAAAPVTELLGALTPDDWECFESWPHLYKYRLAELPDTSSKVVMECLVPYVWKPPPRVWKRLLVTACCSIGTAGFEPATP